MCELFSFHNCAIILLCISGFICVVYANTLNISKCCERDEFYSVPNKRCEKYETLSLKSRFDIRSGDYLSDVLTMLYLDEQKHPNLVYPSAYNITKIRMPDCLAERYTPKVNVPFEDDNEDLNDADNVNAIDFLIDYPSHDLFEIQQYKYHSSDSYCIDITFKDDQYLGILALFCNIPLDVVCKTKKCLRFCCEHPSEVVVDDESPLRRSFHLDHQHCELDPDVHLHSLDNVEEEATNLWLIYGPPNCSFTMHDIEGNQTLYNKNGVIDYGTASYDYNSSCMYQSKQIPAGSSNATYSTHIQLCIPDDSYRKGYLSWIQLIDFQIISGILILSTILLGILVIYEIMVNRDKLFSALRICVIIMYLIINGTLCVVKFQVDVEKKFPNLCVAEAILIQFSYLSSICWLTSMCFDVWIKFRKVRMNEGNQRKSHYKRKQPNGFQDAKFKYYAIYSLGVPLIVSSVTALIHFLPEELTIKLILPFKGIKKQQLVEDEKLQQANQIEDGKSRCFFNDNLSTLLYFFVLTGPMLLINLLLFLLFSWSLCCGIWAATDLALSRYRKNFKRILIMFFTLGLPWICDLIGFITLWWYEYRNMTSNAIIYTIKTVLNVITASQGILMFASIFLFDSSMRNKCGCKTESKTSQPRSIQMSKVQKTKKKDNASRSPQGKQNMAKPVKSKRQTPIMISYERQQHSLNSPNFRF